MTLVLSELSSFGIAMAADSAVTHTKPRTGIAHVTPNSARKLQVIPYLTAGISCWGLGTIGTLPTDQWLNNFINSNSSINTLTNFATELANQLNRQVPRNTSGANRLGFHLAAFENYRGTPTPSFYHVHDGPSTTLQSRGISVNPNQFNANHDVPPRIFQQMANAGQTPITIRNGTYQLYAQIYSRLDGFFRTSLRPLGITIPHSQHVSDRADYMVFYIRLMSEIYRLSNLIPGIGGGIHYLAINRTGIHSQGIKYF